MGRYLDLAKQAPSRNVVLAKPDAAEPETHTSPSKEEQRESLDRLVSQGIGYIQIASKDGEIYIALTDSIFHDLSQRPGLTFYHAAHLIELTDDEIRLLHSLRTMGGSDGSVDVCETRKFNWENPHRQSSKQWPVWVTAAGHASK